MKEATIVFLSHIHPDATLKSDLRKDLDLLFKNVPLNPQEQEILAKKYTHQMKKKKWT